MLAAKDKISVRQAIIIFLVTIYTTAIRLFPVYIAETGGRAGWLAPIFAALPAISLILIIQALFKRDREAGLPGIIYKVLGKFAGKVLLVLYLIWIIVVLGTNVRYFAEKLLSSLFPNTSIIFFTTTILAAIFYVARKGIVPLARTIEFMFLVLTITFFVLFLFTVKDLEAINLFPVTHHDILPVARSSYSVIAIWSTVTYVFLFGEKINDKEHIKRFGFQGALFFIINTTVLLVQTIGMYGHTLIRRVSLPYFFVIKSISILETIERIESVAMAFWVMIDFLTLSMFAYITVSVIKSLFSLSSSKEMVSPVVIFAFIFSQYIAKSRFELNNFIEYIYLAANLFFGYIIPLFLLIIGKIRKKI